MKSVVTAGDAIPGGDRVLQQLNSIYEGHALDTFYSADEGFADDDVASRNFGALAASIYGELLPTTVLKMLVEVAGLKPGQRYYDLGSGTGKTVTVAGLLGLKATGVELQQQRFDGACTAVRHAKSIGVKLPHGAHIQFQHGSFLDVDVSDADLVFTDSVEFPNDLLEGIAKIARRMKPGSKVISARGLPGPGFENKGAFAGPASWDGNGFSSQWMLQTVTGVFDEKAAPIHGGVAFAKVAPQNKCEL